MIVRTVLVAAVVVLGGPVTAKLAPVASGPCASDDGPKAEITTNAGLAVFISGISQRQKGCRQRIARLAEPLLGKIATPQAGDADQDSQTSKLEAARAAFKAASLARECAELELKAYVELTFPQSLATCEHELAEAEADLKQAKANRVTAAKRFDTIKRLLTPSASDLSLRYRFEVGGLRAELEARRAGFSIEQAVSKRKVLEEYEKDKQTKELRSKIEIARSEELRAKAVLELGPLNRPRVAVQKDRLTTSQSRLLGLIDEALSIDGKVQAMIEELSKNTKSDPGLQKEITDRANQLEAIVDRAEDERAVGSFIRLKESVERQSQPKRKSRLPLRRTTNK
jgi:hypothetical protein